MKKRRALDLFCCMGGVTRGLQLAGFEVDGVDEKPQPHYIGDRFFQADAIEFCKEHGHEYDAIWASPPCQVHSALAHFATPGKHFDLIPQTREALIATGKPYVIENVMGALNAMRSPFMLCGTMFLLRTKCGAELRRHRLFETNWDIGLLPNCQHSTTLPIISVYGGRARDRAVCQRNEKLRRTISIVGDHARDPGEERQRYRGTRSRVLTVTGSTPQQNVERNVIRETFPVSAAREAMGIDWMPMKGLSQAIPPAYSKFIGERLLEVI